MSQEDDPSSLQQQLDAANRVIAEQRAIIEQRQAADMARVEWFTGNTMITANQLRKSRGKDLRWEKVGGRTNYSRSDARRRWPNLWRHPRNLTNPTPESGRKGNVGPNPLTPRETNS